MTSYMGLKGMAMLPGGGVKSDASFPNIFLGRKISNGSCKARQFTIMSSVPMNTKRDVLCLSYRT